MSTDEKAQETESEFFDAEFAPRGVAMGIVRGVANFLKEQGFKSTVALEDSKMVAIATKYIQRCVDENLARATARIAELTKERNEAILANGQLAHLIQIDEDLAKKCASLESRLSACEAENKELVEALEKLADPCYRFSESSDQQELLGRASLAADALRAHAARQQEGTP